MEFSLSLGIFFAAFLAFAGFMVYFSFIQRHKSDELHKRLDTLTNSVLTHLSQQLDSVRKEVGERLHENVSLMQSSHQHTSRSVADLQAKLAQLEEATKRIFDVGKDISSLHDILRAPKLRGGVGEYLLGDLLSQYLPEHNFQLQYRFANGSQVDAVIQSREFLIPIDSKFPLENFKRIFETQEQATQERLKKQFAADVKRHIDDIAKKYILPDEGTSDFAIMYVAAENVYYEMIIKEVDGKSLSDYALKKNIIPASPNSFWAYMQAVLVGLKGQQVQKNVKEVMQNISRLRGDIERFNKDFEILGSHLQNARAKYDDSAKRLGGIQDRLGNIEVAKESKRLEGVVP